MEFAYSDIIGLRRPVHDGDVFSRRHPKMTQLNRAKIFAPFDALKGFSEAIAAAGEEDGCREEIERIPFDGDIAAGDGEETGDTADEEQGSCADG
jgi:hypothetical protein